MTENIANNYSPQQATPSTPLSRGYLPSFVPTAIGVGAVAFFTFAVIL